MPAPGAFDADLAEWRAWRPEQVARLLARVDVPWYVAAGWAIDLFLGGQRREHEDLEIGVPADRFGEIADALAGFELHVVGPDPAVPGRDLAVPVAQAGELLERYHQTWLLEREPFVWRLDVFREPSDGDTWICRRDESIRLPYERLIQRTGDGIPSAPGLTGARFSAKVAAAAAPRLRRWGQANAPTLRWNAATHTFR